MPEAKRTQNTPSRHMDCRWVASSQSSPLQRAGSDIELFGQGSSLEGPVNSDISESRSTLLCSVRETDIQMF
jgi:hypothetical protein